MKLGLFTLTWAVAALAALSAAIIRADVAASHSGRGVTVCGSVIAAQQAAQLRGDPVLLTLRQAYAGQDVTVVVLGENRARFAAPAALIGRRLCLSGHVRRFFGEPRMVFETGTD